MKFSDSDISLNPLKTIWNHYVMDTSNRPRPNDGKIRYWRIICNQSSERNFQVFKFNDPISCRFIFRFITRRLKRIAVTQIGVSLYIYCSYFDTPTFCSKHHIWWSTYQKSRWNQTCILFLRLELLCTHSESRKWWRSSKIIWVCLKPF